VTEMFEKRCFEGLLPPSATCLAHRTHDVIRTAYIALQRAHTL